MVAKILPEVTPPTDPWVRSKDQNSTFSEHGHAAYQIKEKHECEEL